MLMFLIDRELKAFLLVLVLKKRKNCLFSVMNIMDNVKI